MKILLLTAYNSAMADLGDLCACSMQAYASRHADVDFREMVISDTYPRPASWSKVAHIRRELGRYDVVQWLDADSMIVGEQALEQLLVPATLNIARDANGINCGVMAWRACQEATEALTRMEAAYERFADHPWFEQAALMEFVDRLDVAYQPKHLYNAYEGDFCGDTLIRHWPGEPNDKRLREMRALAAERGILETSIL